MDPVDVAVEYLYKQGMLKSGESFDRVTESNEHIYITAKSVNYTFNKAGLLVAVE